MSTTFVDADGVTRFRGEVMRGGSSSGAVLQTPPVTLIDAQIRALPTTAVDLVSAVPGALLTVIQAVGVLDNTAGVYGNVDSPSGINLLYGAGGDRASANGDWSWLLTDGSQVGAFIFPASYFSNPAPGVFIGQSDYVSALVGQPLSMQAQNGILGDFTLGDPANTLTVTVLYSVVPI